MLFLGYFVGVFGWVLLWVVFLGVVLVLGGCFGLALVSPMYTTCVLKGALRFFFLNKT